MDQASTSGFMVDSFEGVNDHFTSLEVLGTHGHNVLARARRFGRWYLLKGLAPEVAEQQAYHEMLVKEFDIMMRLQHPGVVQVVSLEDVDGMGKCIVMEWVEGITLSDWLEEKSTRTDRHQVAQQLMDALAHVHQHGVVHRDIKPSNIMVTTNGQHVKIIDFGLADTDVHAVLKQPAGTARYMAPEQASASKPDLRNDIYSLGLVLEQMRLGRLYKRPIARCLQPIDKRYESVEELQNDLRRRSHRSRTAGIVAAVALTAGLSAGIATLIARMQPAADKGNALMVDSLKNRLENTEMEVRQSQLGQDSLYRQLTGMNDSLASVNATNQRLTTEQAERDARQQVVQQAIAEGMRRIDAMNASTHLKQHFDTLSRGEYVWVDWHYLSRRGRDMALPDYMLEIRDRFTTKELSEIQYALTEHCNHYESAIQDRLSQKKGWIYIEDRKIPHR